MTPNIPPLPPTITQGLLKLPGATFATKSAAERLLEEDRRRHHCYWGRIGFHNHLSHHILAAYDLGAPEALLQKIYDVEEKEATDGIHEFGQHGAKEESFQGDVTFETWKKHLGDAMAYSAYVEFFEKQIAMSGVGQVLEQYVFSPAANDNEVYMLLRFVAGVMHPLIQTGYGVEFGSDAMVAQALAQTAVHKPFRPEIFDLHAPSPKDQSFGSVTNKEHRQPLAGQSLLSILRQAYDSDIMKPVMPYDPDAFISKRFTDACTDGRPEEIRRLAALWQIDTSDSTRAQAALDEKVEELIWTTTLLLVGSGRQGHSPRLDFFLMHLLNASLFIPSLLAAIPSIQSKGTLLRTFVPVLLLTLLIRGRPRIDADLVMSYTNVPRPPSVEGSTIAVPSASAVGDAREDEDYNPWPAIIASIVHAPDAHTLKAVRVLYYGAQRYGQTPPGAVIGAFDEEGRETHPGMSKVDGSVFMRAAGVVMSTLGWVTHAQKAGSWDRSALGWDDAWKRDDD